MNCTMSVLGRHRITIGTCNMLGILHNMNFPRGHFSHILIDKAVTDNYKTYSWGINKCGELGLGNPQILGKLPFIVEPREIVAFTGKTIVKVACGIDHTLALTDKGKVYGWGSNTYRQLNLNNRVDLILSPTKLNIDNVKKVSDIAVIDYKSFVKSSVGHIYTWGFIFNVPIKNLVVCECTNAFDICNSMIAHSPMSVACEFINEEFHILNDLETAFNDQSTSDLTIVIEKQTIYVHKAILKIRSIYFENMFRTNCIESKQSIIEIHYYRYVVYKTFLEYLYTGKINLSFFEDLLDLLQLADEVCLKNLQINCIETIKKTITVSNVIHLFNLVNKMVEHYRKELIKYCFNFYFKNMTKVIRTEGFQQLDAATKAMFIDKGRNFFSSRINRSSYLK
ncbi:RCC1 and BTB domain-containing protein 1 [Atta colombica]|uniref:RCC1 and BTB domain-containing protein 1 n=1 Tax=Atta colombica TaxID=520822 RepID=A0A195BSE7_9HYME|nr:RCC1 and BTB domain-containing protein 1 [Atta colombica]